jgi:RNA recognition motif-containing protein
MTSRLHVGNLTAETTTHEITAAFEQDGREVTKVDLVMSRDPGRSRGFAFVEMASADHARTAAEALDGQMMNGRPLKVREAHPPKTRFGGFLGAQGLRRTPSDSHTRKDS